MAHAQLRPATRLDDDFLGTLYHESRAEEVAASGWSDEVARVFLAGQRAAQEAHYRATYPAARHDIIVEGSRPVGRLWVDRDQRRIRLVDISLLARVRGRGIGTGLVGDLIDEAAGRNVSLALSVAVHNERAAALYRRLGFIENGRSDTHVAMSRPVRPGRR